MKSDVALFSKLYIGCQLRHGDMDDFFSHENQACPPSISDSGKLRSGDKSDLLPCLKGFSEPHAEAPNVSAKILDGAAIV